MWLHVLPLSLSVQERKELKQRENGGYDEEVAETKVKMFRISQERLDSELQNGNCKMLCYSSENKDKKCFTSAVFGNES